MDELDVAIRDFEARKHSEQARKLSVESQVANAKQQFDKVAQEVMVPATEEMIKRLKSQGYHAVLTYPGRESPQSICFEFSPLANSPLVGSLSASRFLVQLDTTARVQFLQILRPEQQTDRTFQPAGSSAVSAITESEFSKRLVTFVTEALQTY